MYIDDYSYTYSDTYKRHNKHHNDYYEERLKQKDIIINHLMKEIKRLTIESTAINQK